MHNHTTATKYLFSLGYLTGKDFSALICRGLEWINGSNELQFDMENNAANVVWRCIDRSSSRLNRYLNAAFDRENSAIAESGDSLKALYECRPYELGWLLYAFADRLSLRPQGSQTT